MHTGGNKGHSMTLKSCSDREVSDAAGHRLPIRRHVGRARVLAAALLLVMPLMAQSPGVGPNPPADGPYGPGMVAGGIEAKMEARRIAMLNVIRQKGMISDAQKLLHLAQELNEDAAAGGSKMSDAERVHKASEIEKLAKAVKEKMTYAVGAPDGFSGPFNAWQH
jgi:hypothetical protein